MLSALTHTELTKARTQAELRSWIDLKREEFGRKEEEKHAARLGKGWARKKFKEEVWPLGLFADAFYTNRQDVCFKLVIKDDQNVDSPYDALIEDSLTGKPIEFLQITQASENEQSHLQMQHLNQYGRAPSTGAHFKRSQDGKGVVEIWGEAVEHKTALGITLEDIKKAVGRKRHTRHESQTTLIVEFDDKHICSESDQQVVNTFAETYLLPIAVNFLSLALVSDRQRLAWRYPVNQTAETHG